MPAPSHTPLARFIAGAYSLTSSAAAGTAVTAATAGLTISSPVGLSILGTLAAFAGGAAIYKGYKQGKADDRTAEIHTYLEQLIRQHGDLTKALAALPSDIPLSHGESCGRIRRLAAIFTPDPSGIEDRINADQDFARFTTASMRNIEATLAAHQNDFDRLIQMAFDAKALNEDQLAAIDRVAGSLELLHAKMDLTLELIQKNQKTDQVADYFMDQLHQKNEQLGALQTENDSLRVKVRAAIERVAQVEQSMGRDPLVKLEELRQGDPHELLNFLDDQLDADEREFIEKHRERAAVAFVLGKIAKAKKSWTAIIALQPNDLDAINGIGHLYMLLGDISSAEEQYHRLLELEKDEHVCATALGNIGIIEAMRGNFDAAEYYQKRSLEIDEGLDQKVGMANSLGNLGVIEGMRGNLVAAEAYQKQSLEINEELGRKEGMASNLGNLGVIEEKLGNLGAAEAYQKRAVEVNEELGSKQGLANSLGNLGVIEQKRGNLDAAEAYQMQSLEIEEDLGHKEGIASTLGNLGVIERMRGKFDAAEIYQRRSLEIDEGLGRKEGIANALGNLGRIEKLRGKHKRAGELWTRSRDLFAEIDMPHMVTQIQSMIDSLPPED